MSSVHHPKKEIPENLRAWLSKIGKKGAKNAMKSVSKAQRQKWGRLGGKAKANNANRDR